MWEIVGALAAVAAVVITVLGGLFALWNSIRDRFDLESGKREQQTKAFQSAIDEHEEKDQKRDREYLMRFGRIDTALASVGFHGNGGSASPPANGGAA